MAGINHQARKSQAFSLQASNVFRQPSCNPIVYFGSADGKVLSLYRHETLPAGRRPGRRRKVSQPLAGQRRVPELAEGLHHPGSAFGSLALSRYAATANWACTTRFLPPSFPSPRTFGPWWLP